MHSVSFPTLKVISGSNRLPKELLERSKMSSLGSLRRATQILPLWMVYACGTITSCTMTWAQKNMWTGSQTQERSCLLLLAWSPEMKQNSAVFWTQVSTAQLHPSPLQTLRREHSGSSSTQPGLRPSLRQQTPKIMKTKSLLRKPDFNGLSNLRAEWPVPFMGARYIPHAFKHANGNSPNISCSFFKYLDFPIMQAHPILKYIFGDFILY